MIEPINIIPSPFLKAKFEGNITPILNRSKRLLKFSKNLNTFLERDGGKSSSSDADQPHEWHESQELCNWIMEQIGDVLTYWGYMKSPNQFQIMRSWTNIHPPGGYTEDHQHGTVPIVAVMYLQVPEDSGDLEVFDPMFYNWSSTFRDAGLIWKSIPVTAGDVLFFPGWVLHRTGVNKSQEDRYVISFNIESPFIIDNYKPRIT